MKPGDWLAERAGIRDPGGALELTPGASGVDMHARRDASHATLIPDP
jgi:hypothetical protein